MNIKRPLTKMSVHLHTFRNKQEEGHEVFEGTVPMTQQQQDSYAWALGDEKASVTVSSDLSESNYGNGGKVFVSVTLTCGQDKEHLEFALNLAKELSNAAAWNFHSEMKKSLINKGILKGEVT